MQDTERVRATDSHSTGTIPTAAEQPTMTIWPETAKALGISKSSAYDAASRGEIPTIKLGRRLVVPTAALRRLLQLDEPSSAA